MPITDNAIVVKWLVLWIKAEGLEVKSSGAGRIPACYRHNRSVRWSSCVLRKGQLNFKDGSMEVET